jgi:hypothetical protein
MTTTTKKHELHDSFKLVINDEMAKKFYGDGVWTLRKPKQSGKIPDFSSRDFRGVLAAVNVFKSFPYEYDEESQPLRADPEAVATHMALGLTAIREQGARPLSREFVAGYERMAALVIQPDEAIDEFIATARREPHA